MVFKAGVRNPRNILVLLEPLSQREGISSMALAAQTERLQAEDQLLGSEGVQCRAQITQNLDSHTDGKRNRTEGLPELQTVVSLRGLDELGEAGGVLAPVELAAVDDDAANGGAVATDPLGCALDDDIRAVVDRASEVAAGTEGVVNLRSNKTLRHDPVQFSDYEEKNLPRGEHPSHAQPSQWPQSRARCSGGYQSSQQKQPWCDHQSQRQYPRACRH